MTSRKVMSKDLKNCSMNCKNKNRLVRQILLNDWVPHVRRSVLESAEKITKVMDNLEQKFVISCAEVVQVKCSNQSFVLLVGSN